MKNKALCLVFEINIPTYLGQYHFFDIGHSHDYYDDARQRRRIEKAIESCYLPSTALLMQLTQRYPGLKVGIAISGISLELLQRYSPIIVDRLRNLCKQGYVEILGGCYSHSLVSLADEKEFREQVSWHRQYIEQTFGEHPEVFMNTEFIYSDTIGSQVADMGFKGMVIEGAKHIMGWKNTNNLYSNVLEPQLRLLVRNVHLSDDIYVRFSDSHWDQWPLTAEKYMHWLSNACEEGEVLNLFMRYEAFGELHTHDSGIHDFCMKSVEFLFEQEQFTYLLPTQVVEQLQPVGPLHVPYPTSWCGEEKDVTPWLGNELQKEAFQQLHRLYDTVMESGDSEILKDYIKLQDSFILHGMSTLEFLYYEKRIGDEINSSPYELFITYMNILSDLKLRINNLLK